MKPNTKYWLSQGLQLVAIFIVSLITGALVWQTQWHLLPATFWSVMMFAFAGSQVVNIVCYVLWQLAKKVMSAKENKDNDGDNNNRAVFS